VLDGRVAGVFETALPTNWLFVADGEMDGELYDNLSYSDKSNNESRGSRQLPWELECDIDVDDCDEVDIVPQCIRSAWKYRVSRYRDNCSVSAFGLFGGWPGVDEECLDGALRW
jgi:hypothetical protein